MTSKDFPLFSCIFVLLFVVLTSTTSLAKRNLPNDNKPSPFEFLNQLEGCQKGDNVKGIQELKNYLRKFGYLDSDQISSNDDNNFDDALEISLKTYQRNYHINPTGVLDADTMSKMATPRCGVPDIINGTNFMQAKSKMHDSNSSSNIHTVSHYAFFSGRPRWSDSQMDLTYAFSTNTRSDAFEPVASAFETWASVTKFTFSQSQDAENADIVIGFHGGDHGDGIPFDGPGGTLAHSFAPTDGRFHYDADEQWAVGAVPDAFDLQSIAVHEIGHLLGLEHSDVEEAVMHSGMPSGTVKIVLDDDDIDGIRALYDL